MAPLVIDVQALTNGVDIAVNGFAPHFTNKLTQVFTEPDFYGRGVGIKYIAGYDPADYTAVTTDEFRDVEVTLWGRKFELFLRLTTEGRALRISLNETLDELRVLALKGITTSPFGFDLQVALPDKTSWDLKDFPGYNHDNARGRYWTFGVSGYDFYIKLNGDEVYRAKQPLQIESGKVAIKPAESFGIEEFQIDELSLATLYSDPDNHIMDPRDYGLKNIETTGSIGRKSSKLTVANPTGFEVGDSIIVEIGTESGLGRRGSAGVGGSWPTLSYPNSASRDADATKEDGRWCWVRDTGRTTFFDKNHGTWKRDTVFGASGADYYWQLAIPHSLVAKVIAIAGNILTLDAPAAECATNAKVYIDNGPVLNATQGNGDWYQARTLSLPAGRYACVDSFGLADGHNDWSIIGAGTQIFSPRGCIAATLQLGHADGVEVSGFEVSGNFGSSGYRFPFSGNAEIRRDTPSVLYRVTFEAGTSNDCHFHHLRARNYVANAFVANRVSKFRCHDCEAINDEGQRIYLAWGFQVADSGAAKQGDIVFENCSISLAAIQGGFETFRSDNVVFRKCRSVNGIFSSNSSGNFVFDEPFITIKEGAEISYTNDYGETGTPSKAVDNVIMNINSNISPPSPTMQNGGVITNPTIVIEGPANSSGDTWRGLIVVNGDNPNISIIANPPWSERGCNAPLVGGYFESPDDRVGIPGSGALAVNSVGSKTIVDGIRIAGVGDLGGLGNVSVPANGIIRNCVYDQFLHGGIQTNNLTTAEWRAACPETKMNAKEIVLKANELITELIRAAPEEYPIILNDTLVLIRELARNQSSELPKAFS